MLFSSSYICAIKNVNMTCEFSLLFLNVVNSHSCLMHVTNLDGTQVILEIVTMFCHKYDKMGSIFGFQMSCESTIDHKSQTCAGHLLEFSLCKV